MSEAPQHGLHPILDVRFFRSGAGNEPVREWLKALDKEDRRSIGEDIKTAQFGWPVGMPLIGKLEKNLWEVRATLASGIFTVFDHQITLLHAFIKKSPKTPKNDLDTARSRLKRLEDQ